jgi:transcriptional regulator with XRE-family HTH domain
LSRIKELRKNKGISQVQLASLLDVTQSAVAKWETGESLPRTDKLPDIAKILCVTVDDLLKPTDITS